MNARSVAWIATPIALSVGVIWLSAQEPKPAQPEGIKIGELAEKVQAREKAVATREAELKQLEQRLATLQSTLERDRQDLQSREKAHLDAVQKFENERTRPTLDPQLPRTYEAMDPAAGAQALKELAGINQEVAVGLLGAMTAKKAAKLMDQLALLDPKLAGRLSEKVGTTKASPRP